MCKKRTIKLGELDKLTASNDAAGHCPGLNPVINRLAADVPHLGILGRGHQLRNVFLDWGG